MSITEKVLKARIQAIDNFTKPMQKVISQTKAFQATAKAVKPLVLKAKDMASPIISKVKTQIDKFKASKFGQFILKAKDMASKVLSKISGMLRVFAGKVWSATVSVKDKASSVLSSIQGKLSALAGGITIGVAAKTGFNELANEQTEKLTINRVIQNTGSTKEQAKKATDDYYAYLTEYANKTPFETSAVTQFGTKAMMIAKGDVEFAKKLTDMMGNTKAFVGTLKTETEIAEAFFSASNGNMEMLNNALGTQYQTFEEALSGISEKQGGLVEEMSQTLGGKTSTILGKTKEALKNFVRVFEGPLMNIFAKIESFIGVFSDKLKLFGESVLKSFEAFSKSEQAGQYMKTFQTIGETTFNMIKAVIDAVRPTIESIFNFIGQHSQEISTIVKMFGNIWNSVWKLAGTLLQGAWSICEPILSTLLKALSKVSGAVESICNWWNKMTELLKKPIEATVNIAKKSTSFVSSLFDNKSEGKKAAWGTKRVVGNDVPYRLHDGERVLTRTEADRYERKGDITIPKLADQIIIREEADVKKIANQFVKELKIARIAYCGAY